MGDIDGWSMLTPDPAAVGLTAGLQASASAYQARFDKTFQLSSKGFDGAHVAYAQSLTSSMLGGIGYFYGTSIVDKHFRHEYDTEDDDEDEDSEGYAQQKDPKPELVPARGLYTATPSRSFFPRGFYWSVTYSCGRAMLTQCSAGTKASTY